MMPTFADYGIEVNPNARGDVHVKCPKCSHTHSPANRHKKDLSVNVDEGVWKCHRHECGWTGSLGQSTKGYGARLKVYERPKEWQQAPSNGMYDWFRNERGISRETVDRNGIRTVTKGGKHFLEFPYYRDGEHIHSTFRPMDKKEFFQSTDTERIYYGPRTHFAHGRSYSFWTEGVEGVVGVLYSIRPVGNVALFDTDSAHEFFCKRPARLVVISCHDDAINALKEF